MIKREAKAQVIWGRYVRELKLYGAFELKQTTKQYINFNEVKDHQIEGLLAVQSGGFVWKLSDLDIREKPFDMISTQAMYGYVVIYYSQYKTFVMITIFNFVNEKENSLKKSLYFNKACEIADMIIELSTTKL